MKIKKGKLNYDQSGRAYPPNPRVKENWDCIWEYEGKYYKLVGDNEHKEWDEVNIYNQIIDEVYETYNKEIIRQREIQKEEVNRLRSQMKLVKVSLIELLSKEQFINKCKTDSEFSEKWGLKIEERELIAQERLEWVKTNLSNVEVGGFISNDEYSHKWVETLANNIPTKLITLTYNNETIESYE